MSRHTVLIDSRAAHSIRCTHLQTHGDISLVARETNISHHEAKVLLGHEAACKLCQIPPRPAADPR